MKVLTWIGVYKPGPADPAVVSEDDPTFNIATETDVAPEDGDCGTESARPENSIRGSFMGMQDHLGLDHRAS